MGIITRFFDLPNYVTIQLSGYLNLDVGHSVEGTMVIKSYCFENLDRRLRNTEH